MKYLAPPFVCILILTTLLTILLITPAIALADDGNDRIHRSDIRNGAGVTYGGPADPAKTSLDTARLIGPANLNPVVIGTLDNPATTYSHDFEDGTLGRFEHRYIPGVGLFAQLKADMGDADLCVSNASPQVVFIDDGVIIPETGGSFASLPERMYADGFVVNYTGGLTFNSFYHLRNSVVSPPVLWQEPTHGGARLGYTFYTDSFVLAGEAGVLMEWMIRSTTGTAQDLEDAEWQHSPYVYQGGPFYGREFWDVSGMLEQGRTYVQVALGATEIAYVWGIDGINGSPSPYFDNVRLESFPHRGPALTAHAENMPQDAFPAIGIIDEVDLGRNSVRFDMAKNISNDSAEHYHAGDSIVIDAVAVRTGAQLTDRPTFHYTMRRNPLFDPYRLPDVDWPATGTVVMDTCFSGPGIPVRDRFTVDLPDTGFLFPGDILHWYFSAEDAIDGYVNAFTSVLPADISRWGDFDQPVVWSEDFTLRALPTVVELYPGRYITPPLLFWDDADSADRQAKNAWHWAFIYSLRTRGVDYDVYYSKAPSSAVGNGISRAATDAQLARYSDMIYSCGDHASTTLSSGSWSTGGDDDITSLNTWLDLGDRDMFLTGNNLAYDLSASSAATMDFLNSRMMVALVDRSHRDLLEGQLAPRVLVTESPWNPVFYSVSSWIAFGGCPDLWDFDIVNPIGAGQRLAVFADPSGVGGWYPYSPVTLAEQGNGSRIISMTQDLAYVERDPHESSKSLGTPPTRARILNNVLDYFGTPSSRPPWSDVPLAREFRAWNYPNPFNPSTKIAYTIEEPGLLVVKVFNVRGELVKKLIDRHVDADGYVEWNGTNGQGSEVASGVYFYRAQMGNNIKLNKMALVR